VRDLIVTLAFAILLSGCSRQKIMGADDLRSQLTAAISLTSETETFLDYVTQHRSTGNFAAGHLAYLSQTAAQAAKQVQQSTPTYSIQQQFTQSRQQLDALASQLASLQQEVAVGQTPAAANGQLVKLRHSLQQIKAGL
jgi:soluble lytic murein transglycosylase-like protein